MILSTIRIRSSKCMKVKFWNWRKEKSFALYGSRKTNSSSVFRDASHQCFLQRSNNSGRRRSKCDIFHSSSSTVLSLPTARPGTDSSTCMQVYSLASPGKLWRKAKRYPSLKMPIPDSNLWKIKLRKSKENQASKKDTWRGEYEEKWYKN